jgi:hypothetical protein
LYKTKTRFLYEIIQNAEDNLYSKALAKSESPWLVFTLKQDRIIIDSNEDGFTEANVRAICSTGESTKAFNSGYIGEKGIGFKSVFKAAYKVHIQSEPFSFMFQYRKDDPNDNGIGMTSPINEPYSDIPTNVKTRMTLYLSEDLKVEELKSQFLDIQDTLLLFLKKLKSITIRINLENQQPIEKAYSITSKDHRVEIRKIMGADTATKYFWTVKRRTINMPHEETRHGIDQAIVILAFPMTENDEPIIEDQQIYAFLPLRTVGYSFLIQSDFVTQASREDVFYDSEWNKRLLNVVVNAFIGNVDAFLQHPTLRYRWVRYIPVAYVNDVFWRAIQTGIQDKLSSLKYFESDSKGLQLPKTLRVVPNQYRFSGTHLGIKHGPILRDMSDLDTAYISDEYQASEIEILRHLGTSILSYADFLYLLYKGLERSDSHVKSTSFSDEWHTCLAKVLYGGIQSSKVLQFVRKLNILPIGDTTTDEDLTFQPFKDNIYFPTSGGIMVPNDLKLRLLNSEAVKNETWKKVYQHMKVTECTTDIVFDAIEQKYRSGGHFNLYQHVNFIYWHHDKVEFRTISIRILPEYPGAPWFWIDHKQTKWTYDLESSDPLSMRSLFGDSPPENLKNRYNFPGRGYYSSLKQLSERHGKKPLDWFNDFLDAHSTPQLQRKGDLSNRRSYEIEYIANSRPEFLLRVLRKNWTQYALKEDWDVYFKNIEIPILDSEQKLELSETYLPLPKLLKIVETWGLGKGFGFISELVNIKDEDVSSWSFLSRFSVGTEADERFWCRLLNHAKRDEADQSVVFEIYRRLQAFAGANDESLRYVSSLRAT